MKISKMYKLIVSCFILTLSLGVSINASAQCGTEPITVHPWCENTYAQWDFTSPTTNAQYTWYNYVAGTPGYDAAGKLVKDGATAIAPIDSTTAATYYSKFRVTTAGIAPATSVNFTYQKRVQYTNINSYSGTPTYTAGTTGSTFTMDFTATFASAQGLRFNYVTVPVQLNTVGQQYKIQVSFAAPNAGGSAIYTFSTVGAQNIGGNNYLVKIPVNYTITTAGAQKMIINTNPTGGTGVPVDKLLYASTQAPAFSAAGNPISWTAAAGVAGPSGGFSQIYNWDYTIVCNAQNAGASSKTTTGCCVVPSSIGLLSLNADKSTIVNGGAVNVNFTVGSGNAANYFGWYLNGVLVPAASGIGKTTYSSNLVGTWEVREVTNSADLNNPSCTVNASVVIQDKKIFLTNVTSPSHTPLCIGDQWTFTGTGSSSLTWSSGKGTLSPTTGTSTTYTATSVGTDVITLTGNVPTQDKVVDGDFSVYNDGSPLANGASSAFSSISGNPANTDGKYNFGTSSLGGGWGNSDWSYGGARAGVTAGNPGKFMLVNATSDPSSPNYKTLVWGKSVSVQPGQAYNFSFDLTSISYIISSDPNINNYTASAPNTTYPYLDVLLDVYINGVKLGQATTDFANNGGLSAIGKWKNNSYAWTAGSSTTQAVLELRFASPFANGGRGYDFGLDNILFGGSETQTDTYAIGNVTDCSTITASASACVNDTYSNLTATLTGGLIFDHWEKTSAPGVSVGTTNPLQVSSLTATSYTAVATLALGNLLDNGDFESGPSTGFISGSPYYTYSTNLAGGGNNAYNVSTDTKNGNGAWLTLAPPPGSTGTKIFAADAKGPVGQKIIAWQFTAVAGKQYFFSGWVSNNHIDFTNTNAATANSANIGVAITAGVPNSATDPIFTSVNLPKTIAWTQMVKTWTAPTSGTYTLYLIDLNGASGGSNDFVLDDFALRPSAGITKTATTTTPVCDPCLSGIPTVATKTFCGNTGTVKLTPAASDPAGVQFNWYATSSSIPVIGTSLGSATTTLDLTGIAADGSGNKTVYYQKSAKGTGTVFTKAQSCTPNYQPQTSYSSGNLTTQLNNIQNQGYHATKAIQIQSFAMMVEMEIQDNGCTMNGSTTFQVVGAKSGSGGLVEDPTVVYGTLSGTFSRTKTAADPQKLQQEITLTGTASVPANTDFFIIAKTVTGTMTGTSCNYARVNFGVCENDLTFPMVDTYDGVTVSRTSSSSNNGGNGGGRKGGTPYNITFAVPAYPCPRVAVVLTPNCPCTKPTAVTISSPTSGTTICEGTAQAIAGTASVAAAPLNTNFTYSWIKTAGTGTGVKVAPTALTNPGSYPGSLTIPNYTGITGLVADAGTYTLRVEDGNTGNSSCYTEATVVINIDPVVTTPAITAAQTICTGTAPAQIGGAAAAGGSTTATATYVWESSANGSTGWTTIAGATLKDYTPGTLTADTYYRRTDKKGVCAGVVSNVIKITVDPVVTTPAITAAQTICSGTAPAQIGGAAAAGGSTTATATYVWESSANGSTGWTTIAGATLKDYTPGTLTADTYYRRTDKKGACAGAVSNVIKITVDPVVTTPAITSAQTICTGTAPAQIGGAAAAGGSTTATATYVWESSANGSTGWTTIAGATLKDYTPGTLTADTYYRRTDTKGVCAGVVSNVIKITVDAVVTIPAITADQTICSGTAPAQIGGAAAAGGSTTATATYVWESSANGTTGWTTIAGATLKDYTPGTLTADTYYRRTDKKGVCAGAVSNVIKITVDPVVTAPAITAAQTICSGTAPAQIGGAAAAGGSTTATATYVWESSANGSTGWTTIAGATLKDYTPGTLTADTYYRRTDKKGACAGAVSNVIKITVDPVVTTPAITAAQTICSGTAPAQIGGAAAAGGSTTATATYVWESSANGSTGWTTIAGATLKDYTPGTLTADTYYRRTDTKGVCAGVVSNVIKITVDAVVTTPAITADQTICTGTTPAQIGGAAAAGGSTTATATYVWESSANGSTGWTTIAGATLKDYTPGTLTTDTYYRRTDKKGVCAAVVSNVVKITVSATASPSITVSPSKNPICAGESVTFTANFNNGGTAPTFEWFIDGTSQGAPSTTATTFTRTTFTSGNQITARMVSNSACAVPATITSAAVTMTVNPNVTPTVTLTADKTSICPGDMVNYTATSTNGGTPTYTWNGTPTAAGTGATYSTTALTAGNSITVTVNSSLTCVTAATATSSPVVVTVTPVPTINVSIVSDVLAICANNPVVFTATVTGSGSTPAPTYQWFITSSSTTTPPGTSQGAPSTTATTFTTSALTATNNKVYVQVVSNATCASTAAVASNVVAITVNAGIGAGTIGTDQPICYNTIPPAFTETVAPIGILGTPTYTWEASPTGLAGSYVTIPGATNASYTSPIAITQDVYVRRNIKDPGTPAPCNVATSNVVHITVRPNLVAGTIAGDQTICSGATPTAFTSVTLPTGGTGTYTYQWQSDASGTMTNIANATNATYASGALTTTTKFRRAETSGLCGTVYSNVVTVTITSPETVSVSINDPGQVCAGSTAFTFTATPITTGSPATLSYEWYLSGTTAPVSTAITYTYNPVIADNSKTVKVIAKTSNGCNTGPATSNIVTLDIVNSTTPTVSIATINNPNCAGFPSTFTATATGTGTAPTYQWYVNGVAASSGVTGPITKNVFTTTSLVDGDKVKVELTSSLGCLIGTNPFPSNEITMKIKPIPTPVINEGDQIICSPNSFPFTVTVGLNTTFEWYKDGLPTGVKTSTYNASESGIYTVVEDNGTCNATSLPSTLDVVATPVADAGADIYIKEGDMGRLNGSGGALYTWTPATGLSDVNSNTPTFLADQNITYTLKVADASNTCSSTDQVNVFVEKAIVIPNVITVNGDGTNDTWEIKNIESFPNAEFLIYNRWGNLVWKSSGYPKKWDGSNYRNGEVLPEGTYFYIIDLHSQIYTEPYTGWVQIVQ